VLLFTFLAHIFYCWRFFPPEFSENLDRKTGPELRPWNIKSGRNEMRDITITALILVRKTSNAGA
jgi:hypothetical protein